MRSDRHKKRGLFGSRTEKKQKDKSKEKNIDFLESANKVKEKLNPESFKPQKSVRHGEDIGASNEQRVVSFSDLEIFDREYEERNKRRRESLEKRKNSPKPSSRRLKASTIERDEYLAARARAKEEAIKSDDKRVLGKKDRKRLEKEWAQAEKVARKEQITSKKKKDNGRDYSQKGGRGCLKAFLILIILIGVLIAGVYCYLHDKVGKMQHIKTSTAEFQISEKAQRELSGYRNIAILGIDARKGQSFKGTRSDAVIIASINKETNDVKLISVMRDTMLPMKSLNGTETYEKITHAHAYNGALNTCVALNRSLDLNISEFLVMNWNSVADTVDQMGGITVNVKPNEIRDLNHWGPETARNTDRTWKYVNGPGKQELNGVQAATYCRIRKTSGGDPGRTNRMKKVIRALLSKAKSNPGRINNTMDVVMPQLQTNMGTSDFTSLIPKLVNFEIKDSIGFPFDYFGGSVNGMWQAVPRTLESNVVKLHKKAFNQKKYKLSSEAKKINQRLIELTGVQ